MNDTLTGQNIKKVVVWSKLEESFDGNHELSHTNKIIHRVDYQILRHQIF